MNLYLIFESIAMIFLMISIGALVSRTITFNSDTQGVFISLIVNVAMPCIILASIFTVEIDYRLINQMGIVFLSSIAIGLIGILIGFLSAHYLVKEKRNAKEFAIMSGLGNTAFIGIPVCAMIFGAEGALLAAVFDAGVDVIIWSLGAVMLQYNEKFSLRSFKPMINPPMIAIVLGLCMTLANLKPPELLIDLTVNLSNLAAPMAMFYLGILLMEMFRHRTKNEGIIPEKVWLPISIKLLILPIFVAICLSIFHINAVTSQVIVLQTMMPTLTLASILFARFSANVELGTKTTVISTIVSLGSIPLVVFIVKIILN